MTPPECSRRRATIAAEAAGEFPMREAERLVSDESRVDAVAVNLTACLAFRRDDSAGSPAARSSLRREESDIDGDAHVAAGIAAFHQGPARAATLAVV